MGALALFAKEAGYEVFGSDLNPGPVVKELEAAGIQFKIGPEAQDGRWLQECIDQGVEWFVYTSALPADHTELVLAGEKLKCTKRDGLISEIVRDKGLKMVAVAGTHGKTPATSYIFPFLIWWVATCRLVLLANSIRRPSILSTKPMNTIATFYTIILGWRQLQ